MRNKISKKAVILISIAIMVLGSMSLFAQYGRGYGYGCGNGYGRGGYGRGGCGYGRGYNYGYYNDELTQAQIDEIRRIQDKYYPQMDELRMETYTQNQILNAEMRKETPDQNALDNAIEAKSKASSELEKLRTKYFLEIEKVYQNK